VTVDAILEWRGRRVLLVERRYPPYGLALPGGFVEAGETLEEACRREVAEETGLTIHTLRQFHAYSDPRRDPRHPTVSVVFVARADGEPRAGDDAAGIRIVPLDALPEPLCFDHAEILADYRSGRWGIGPEET
jgi:ADP-ribose pyrophosphatase YjhB (NUDIX family)